MSTISGKRDAKNQKMALKANDLGKYARSIWLESDLEAKKALAIEMANHFEVGGKQKFIDSVNGTTSSAALDTLVSNAMLKGEGMSTKRF
jgi:hypothetical protein